MHLLYYIMRMTYKERLRSFLAHTQRLLGFNAEFLSTCAEFIALRLKRAII
jgi:hypothetical protein